MTKKLSPVAFLALASALKNDGIVPRALPGTRRALLDRGYVEEFVGEDFMTNIKITPEGRAFLGSL